MLAIIRKVIDENKRSKMLKFIFDYLYYRSSYHDRLLFLLLILCMTSVRFVAVVGYFRVRNRRSRRV